MKQNFKYFSLTITIVIIALATIFLSGCAPFFKSTPEQPEIINPEKNTAPEESADNNAEYGDDLQEDDQTDTESDGLTDEKQQDFSQSAYYYYIKSERHKQKGEIALAIEALNQAIANDPESIYLKKNLIFLHLLNKDNVNALAVARSLSIQHPENEEILLILAKLRIQSNHINEAKSLYQHIIKINPDNHDAYIVLGNIYMENRQTEEAFSLFSEMVRRFPDSYGAHFFLGKINVQKRHFIQAEKEFLKTAQLKPDLLEAKFELISLYKSGQIKQKNLTKKVIELYESILQLEKDNIKASIELPIYLYKTGSKRKASEMLVKFGQKYQNNDAIMTAMAKELINNKNNNDAMIVFNEILSADPGNSTLHYLAGLTFDSLNKKDEAISHFLKVTPDSKQYQKAVFHTAYLYSQQKKTEQAIKYLESKSGYFQKNTDFITYLASFYEESNQLDKAMSLLQKGLVDAPDDTELLFRVGVISDKTDDKKSCIEAMKKVIELDSGHANALNYLGYTYAELDINLDEAEELITRALEIKPNDGYITDSLGWVYFKKGRYDKAVAILEKALHLSSGDPTISEHLGDAYMANKMYSQAIDAYKNALSKNQNPDNKAALEKKVHETEMLIKKKK